MPTSSRSFAVSTKAMSSSPASRDSWSTLLASRLLVFALFIVLLDVVVAQNNNNCGGCCNNNCCCSLQFPDPPPIILQPPQPPPNCSCCDCCNNNGGGGGGGCANNGVGNGGGSCCCDQPCGCGSNCGGCGCGCCNNNNNNVNNPTAQPCSRTSRCCQYSCASPCCCCGGGGGGGGGGGCCCGGGGGCCCGGGGGCGCPSCCCACPTCCDHDDDCESCCVPCGGMLCGSVCAPCCCCCDSGGGGCGGGCGDCYPDDDCFRQRVRRRRRRRQVYIPPLAYHRLRAAAAAAVPPPQYGAFHRRFYVLPLPLPADSNGASPNQKANRASGAYGSRRTHQHMHHHFFHCMPSNCGCCNFCGCSRCCNGGGNFNSNGADPRAASYRNGRACDDSIGQSFNGINEPQPSGYGASYGSPSFVPHAAPRNIYSAAFDSYPPSSPPCTNCGQQAMGNGGPFDAFYSRFNRNMRRRRRRQVFGATPTASAPHEQVINFVIPMFYRPGGSDTRHPPSGFSDQQPSLSQEKSHRACRSCGCDCMSSPASNNGGCPFVQPTPQPAFPQFTPPTSRGRYGCPSPPPPSRSLCNCGCPIKCNRKKKRK